MESIMRRLIYLSFMLLFSSTLFAEKCPPPFKTSRIYFGPQVYYQNLKAKKFATYSGALGGLVGGYEYRKKNNLYVGMHGTYALGKVTASNNRNRFLHNAEIEGNFGYNYVPPCLTQLTITPFSGYGFDYSKQSLNTKGFSSIKLTYEKYYIPLGFILNYAFDYYLALGLKFKWMPYVDRSLETDVTKGASWKIKYTNGFYLDIPVTWTFLFRKRAHFGVSFIPFFKYSEDGATFAETFLGIQLNLPAQRNILAGAKVALNIDF